MKMKLTYLAVILCIILSGCMPKVQNQAIQSESEKDNEKEAVAGDNTDVESMGVSSLATVDYLLPLEEYSWERTEKAEYIMLHFTSAVVLSKEDPYNMDTVRQIFTDNGVSIHYIVDRDGNIYCYIPETRAAWHAGVGTLEKDEKYTNSMNKYSIGIEILAIGSKKDMAQYLTSEEYNALDKSYIGFTDAQYESLRLLVKDICERSEIPFDREHIIGHSMYNPSKSDPGELFEWDRLFSENK